MSASKLPIRMNKISGDFLVCLGVCLLVCYFSITSQSLWIDEGVTAWLASFPSFTELLQTQKNLLVSEAQMPFFVWYIWGWAQVFGLSEVSLRMANIPFALLFFLCIQRSGKLLYGDRWIWIIVGVHPFIWFYLNEARPYVPILGLSSLAVFSLLSYLIKPESSRNWAPWLCLTGLFASSGFSMLGVFLFPAFLTACLIVYRNNRTKWIMLVRDWKRSLIVYSPFFLIMFSWFAWTLLRGGGGARETPGLANLAFAGYEAAGLLGLGPPRNVLRAAPNLGTVSQYAIPLACGVGCWLIAIGIMIINIKNSTKNIGLLFGMLLGGLIAFFLAAFIFNFRFWGRHLAQFFPILVLIILGLLGKPIRKGKLNTLPAIAFSLILAVWLTSSLRLTYNSAYDKDDYRQAASVAVKTAGEVGTVFWAAHNTTGAYYGIGFISHTVVFNYKTSLQAFLVIDQNDEQLADILKGASRPIVIVLGKADLFDKQGALRRIIKKYKAKLIAAPNMFQIYVIN